MKMNLTIKNRSKRLNVNVALFFNFISTQCQKTSKTNYIILNE